MSIRLLGPAGGLFAFLLGFVVVFTFGTTVTDLIVAPLCDLLAMRGQSDCTLVFLTSKEAFLLNLRQALLAGMICAMPSIVAALARVLAPTLARMTPQAIPPFAIAGGVIAVAGAVFAIFYEAPVAFAPALLSLTAMSSGVQADLGLVTNYANAVVVMAGSYVLTLQLPVLALMMIKSMRTRRMMDAETTT